jgi:guanosine-3',5'-bis(diphosphate) 3'-pyrophosphohydrolase
MILKAAEFAANKHRGQFRKGNLNTPYINHPVKVASVLEEVGIDDHETLAAALLHDVIEDTDTTHSEIKNVFNRKVADIVLEVSDDKEKSKKERKDLQIEGARFLTYEAKLIRIADKICNIQDVSGQDSPNWNYERKYEYLEWAKKVVDQINGTNEVLESIFYDEHRWGRLKI